MLGVTYRVGGSGRPTIPNLEPFNNNPDSDGQWSDDHRKLRLTYTIDGHSYSIDYAKSDTSYTADAADFTIAAIHCYDCSK